MKISMLKRELVINELALSEAIQQKNMELIHSLKTQRDNLKNMLIEAQDELISSLQSVEKKAC